MDFSEEPIRIEGLSLTEKWYLEIIWNIQTREELDEFVSHLEPDQRKIVKKLQTLLFMEVLDQDLEKKTSFPMVKDYLKRFMKS